MDLSMFDPKLGQKQPRIFLDWNVN